MMQRPWTKGGKSDALEKFEITMTHDELEAQLGDAAEIIHAAGFVLDGDAANCSET